MDPDRGEVVNEHYQLLRAVVVDVLLVNEDVERCRNAKRQSRKSPSSSAQLSRPTGSPTR